MAPGLKTSGNNMNRGGERHAFPRLEARNRSGDFFADGGAGLRVGLFFVEQGAGGAEEAGDLRFVFQRFADDGNRGGRDGDLGKP